MRRTWLVLGCLGSFGCTVPNPLLNDSEGGSSTGSDATSSTGGTTESGPDGSTSTDSGSTGTVDTTGSDDSSTGSPGCAADEVCISAAPEGWNGPVALVDTAAPDAPPGCSGRYPTPSIELGYDKVDGDDSCDCACAQPSGTACTGPQLFNYNNDNCSGNPRVTFTLNQSCQDITDQDPDDSWEAVSVIDGGSCAALASGSVEETTFGHDVALCAAIEASGPCEGGTCLPVPEPPFADRLCVWQAGEAECPEGPFTDRSVRYGGIDQGRSCATCSCGDPEGTCSGSIVLRTGAACDGIGAGTVQLNGNCVQGVGVSLIVRVGYSTGDRNESCEPSAPGVTGESTVTDPVTICCTAPTGR